VSSWQSRLTRLYLNYLKATTNWDAPLAKLRRDADNGARTIVLFCSRDRANRHRVLCWSDIQCLTLRQVSRLCYNFLRK
jgi:hypothetical protein